MNNDVLVRISWNLAEASRGLDLFLTLSAKNIIIQECLLSIFITLKKLCNGNAILSTTLLNVSCKNLHPR